MADTEMKFCKMCYREIDARARKCPNCQHWQNKWTMTSIQPLFAVIILFSFVVPYYLMLKPFFDEGADFKLHIDDITVQESRLIHSGPKIRIVGTVVNTGEFSWKDVQLEVQLFDKDGKLIDATQESKHWFVIPANDSSAFRIRFEEDFPEEHYASHKVRVVFATDARRRF